MRRSLITTVAAAVALALLAMLVPMGFLVQSFALEDRLSLAALEVQATETVVSGQDKGAVAVYLDRANRAGTGGRTTVLYPDGTAVGPTPGEDQRVTEARATGRARVDDTGYGAQILVPVSLGGNSTLPELTPVVRVEVFRPTIGESGIFRAWAILSGLALTLLVGAVALADRLGRSFVRPMGELVEQAQGIAGEQAPPMVQRGPPEVREVSAALNQLVERIQTLLERERRIVADLSHTLRTPMTAMRLRVDAITDERERQRLSAELDHLAEVVDEVVREARRSDREGIVATSDARAVLEERTGYWSALAEDQGRPLRTDLAPGRWLVRTGSQDLAALVDVLLDNVFNHTPEGAEVAVSLAPAESGGVVLLVEDGGPGFPTGVDVRRRGASGGGSTGLGLSIVERTAHESGGSLRLGRSELGGALVRVHLGSPR